eukprot:COSAG01_NODE_1075_length_11852_cov_4.249128_4_plen_172_part_00
MCIADSHVVVRVRAWVVCAQCVWPLDSEDLNDYVLRSPPREHGKRRDTGGVWPDPEGRTTKQDGVSCGSDTEVSAKRAALRDSPAWAAAASAPTLSPGFTPFHLDDGGGEGSTSAGDAQGLLSSEMLATDLLALEEMDELAGPPKGGESTATATPAETLLDELMDFNTVDP